MAAIAVEGPREHWITPQEQLKRLTAPLLTESSKYMVSALANLVVEYLSSNLTNWYTALKRLGPLPGRIPALPEDIHQILDSDCPIRSNERKPDGSRYKINDTHSLYLIPAGTLNELEARVSAYGRAHLAEYGGENPLQFRYFWDAARREHGDVRFNEPQWILISNDILPESRSTSYPEQVKMVETVNTRDFIRDEVRSPYEVPLLREAVAFAFLHKVATGESVLQAGNERNEDIYTSVQETTDNAPLAVGGFAPDGLYVASYYFAGDRIGVGVVRKF